MKLYTFLILTMFTLYACKQSDELVETATNENTLYIKFDIDDQNYEFQSEFVNLNSQATGIDSISFISSDIGFILTKIALQFNFKNTIEILGNDILDLEGQSMTFNDQEEIYPEVRIKNNELNLISHENNMSNAYLSINEVIESNDTISSYFGNAIFNSFKVSGTFECSAINLLDSSFISISNGEFKLCYVKAI